MKPTSLETDCMNELLSIGAGHASGALSKLTDKKVEVSFPEGGFYDLEKIISKVTKPHELCCTIYFRIDYGECEKDSEIGSFLVIFPHSSAQNLVSFIKNKEEVGCEEDGIPVLKEVGNILVGSSLNAMSQIVDDNMTESIPYFAHDMFKATLDQVLAKYGLDVQQAFLFKTSLEIFSPEADEINSYFLMLFNPKTLNSIISNIRSLYKEALIDVSD